MGTKYVVDALGGRKALKVRELPTSTELRDRIKEGLPFSALESVRERLGLSVPETATILQMPPRTLARRRQARRLAADESDRLYRLVRIAAQAVATLGSEEKAAAWLRHPNRALGNEPPLHLLDTDVGTRQVEDVLGRIEHGIPS
jgi:putative toxin-antitoxin system antitoxin component (TIGR02293 family)